MTCFACKAENATLDGDFEEALCDDCRAQRRAAGLGGEPYEVLVHDVPDEIVEPWHHREPSPRRSPHHTDPIVLGNRTFYQQSTPVHVVGGRYRARAGHRAVVRELPEQEAARRSLLLEMDAAGLTPEQRAPLLLQLEGLIYKDIAARLKISVVTVRERLRRARARLLGHREAE